MKKGKNGSTTPAGTAGLPTRTQLRLAITTRLSKYGITRQDLVPRLEAKLHAGLAEAANKLLEKVLEEKSVLAEFGGLLTAKAASEPAAAAPSRPPATPPPAIPKPAAKPAPSTTDSLL